MRARRVAPGAYSAYRFWQATRASARRSGQQNGEDDLGDHDNGGTLQRTVAAAGGSLAAAGIKSRVVSMPSWELFEHQPQEYKDSVLPPSVTARVSVEQASTMGWDRYTGLTGKKIGMRTFGASAPLKELQKKFGFHPENVVAAAREQLGSKR